MHIKDLKMDVELDSTALATIRGGGGNYLTSEAYPTWDFTPMPMQPQQPQIPTFGGDWAKLNADVKNYIGGVKAGAGFPGHDIIAPGRPEIAPAPGYIAI